MVCCLIVPVLPASAQEIKEVIVNPEDIIMLSEQQDLSDRERLVSLLNHCQSLFYEGRYEDLLFVLNKALSESERKGEGKTSSDIANMLGFFCHRMGRYSEAMNYYESAIRFPESDSAKVYHNMGSLLRDIGLNAESITTLQKVITISKRTDNHQILTLTWSNLAFLHLKEARHDLAEQLFRKAYALALETGDKYGRYYSGLGLGTLYSEKGMYDLALSFLEDTLRKNIDFFLLEKEDIVQLEAQTGIVYYHQHEYRKAEELLLNAYNGASVSCWETMMQVSPYLSELYLRKKDYINAYDILVEYGKIKDSIELKRKGDLLQSWVTRHTREKDKKLVEQELELVRQDNELKARNLWLVTGIGGILLLLALFIGMLRRHRHRVMRMEQELEIDRLRSLVKGEEQERSRIALELHNGIAGQVWAAKMEIDHLRRQATVPVQREGLSTVYHYLQDTAEDIRNTAHNLAPGLLLEEGLAKAVESFCEKAGKRSGMTADFSVCGYIPRLDQDIELLVFRIIQELVQNILKHAEGATRFLVQLGCSHDWVLNLTVEDNGSGFDRNKYVPGLGLKSISEKVAALGGYFDIRSDTGRGTTVYMEFGVELFFPDKKVTI